MSFIRIFVILLLILTVLICIVLSIVLPNTSIHVSENKDYLGGLAEEIYVEEGRIRLRCFKERTGIILYPWDGKWRFYERLRLIVSGLSYDIVDQLCKE